ncbi:MAG: D-glycerate dehydrogenase [Candidatus Paceibacterota bacterium]
MHKVYITRKIPEAGLRKLVDAGYSIIENTEDRNLTRQELIAALSEHNPDAVICLLTDTIDEEIFEAAPNAKIFANYAVGYDNLDIRAAHDRNITLTNTPGVLTDTVAEHTVALLLSLTSRIAEADRYVRAGKFKGWAPLLFLGNDLKGKTLGILGAGRIGSRVAEIAYNGLGMEIFYYDLNENSHLNTEYSARFCTTIEEILEQADVISVHLPLLDSTRHILNEKNLAVMKPTSYLINTSRGPVIDEKALVDALQRKIIKGAALDVFENEPELTSGLAELDNTVLTPHIASATEETRSKMSELAAENIIAFFNGEKPKNLIQVS